MIFDFIILGIGALSRKIKDDNMLMHFNFAVFIWQQAKENNSMITINGHTHMFLTPHEIYINEKFWDSGMEMDDFLVKFYLENNKTFFKEFIRLIDKSGVEHTISSLYVSDLYYKYKKNKKV